MTNLNTKTVAVLAADGFEESELTRPLLALKEHGATARVIAPHNGAIRAWRRGEWGPTINVDVPLEQAGANDYDALVIPGGVNNTDALRLNDKAVAFVRAFFADHKPVSAICHGPQLLIEAGVLDGRRVTSHPAIRTDVENAGADWINEAVVVDYGLTTSRDPDDLPDFIHKTIEEIAAGTHLRQTA